MAQTEACHRPAFDAISSPTSPTLAEGGPPFSEAAPPPALPGYHVGEPIGRGGFSVVWAASRAESLAPAALKVGLVDNALTHERFRREAEAIERVGPPHVPRLYASGRLDDGRPFIAMERLDGVTLAARLRSLREPPEPGFVIPIADAVLGALEAVHAKGLLHRDLKPENIFFNETTGRVTLIDFSLTRDTVFRGDDLTRPGTTVGTLEYMAPEQLRGERVLDERTDVYAFGVILFELLTLQLPFGGDVAAIEHGHLALRPPRPRQLADVPAAIEEITLACLAKEPERRPPSASALRHALAGAATRVASSVYADTASVTERVPASGPASGPVSGPASGPASGLPRITGPLSLRGGRLLVEGRRPMIIMVVETGGGTIAVNAAVTGRNGFVARQRGNRYVCVFSGTDTDAPVQTAVATAREVVRRFGGRAALHLAGLTLRRPENGPPAVYGAPVERPETWLPADFSGVVLTLDFARAIPAHEIGPIPQGAAFLPLPDPEIDAERITFAGESEPLSIPPLIPSEKPLAPPPLTGRDGVLRQLAESITASFEEASPGLFTLVGDQGLGKSRMGSEAATVARCLCPDVAVLLIRSTQPLEGDLRPTTRDLLLRILGPEAAVTPADPRALCVERLGQAVDEQVFAAIAASLGWAAPEAAATTPSAIHHGAMRAIAEGLLRMARERPVAVILDDAHWADDAALDALEYATLGAADCPLWVMVAADGRLERARNLWGARAHRHDRAVLAPLDEPAAMQLTAALLLPVEYPPAEVLKHISDWAGRNPACLADLVRTLKLSGIVRRRRVSGSYYVATAELERLPPSTAWQWLAVRQMDALPPELSACVRLCSVLGAELSRQEAERVQDALERAGEESTPVDMGVGLSALAERRILLDRGGEQYAFQSAAFQDAVYKLLDPARRERIHRHACDVWRAELARARWTSDNAERLLPGVEQNALERLARHAGACGERHEAAAAHLTLGDLARAKHRHVQADQHYTAALTFLDEADVARRALTLAGRGKSRYRIYRASEALEDLRAARDLASALGDGALMADILLEEATALDHAGDLAESARRVDEARPIVEQLGEQALTLRFLVALGRSRWRHERVGEAIELLSQGADRARDSADYDTRVIALLMLSCALAAARRTSEAMARFDEVIELATSADDRLHLGMAHLNRVLLWLAQHEPERAAQDLRRAVVLAREVGNPWLERAATYNRAEVLYWSGGSRESNEALELARRSRVLMKRFVDRPTYEDTLLLARIRAMRGEYAEAKRLIDWIAAACPPGQEAATARALLRTLRLVLAEVGAAGSEPGDRWEDVLADAQNSLLTEELLEILYWKARIAYRDGRIEEAEEVLEQASAKLDACPGWRARFEGLQSRVSILPAQPLSPSATPARVQPQ